ncbi:MAG: hypothetical protein MZU97_16595 [Bacillus subtilis]|nr:hypothetical protein [Bacillus subtilis]
MKTAHILLPYIQAAFTPAQAFSYMTFALLSAPCIAGDRRDEERIGRLAMVLLHACL